MNHEEKKNKRMSIKQDYMEDQKRKEESQKVRYVGGVTHFPPTNGLSTGSRGDGVHGMDSVEDMRHKRLNMNK